MKHFPQNLFFPFPLRVKKLPAQVKRLSHVPQFLPFSPLVQEAEARTASERWKDTNVQRVDDGGKGDAIHRPKYPPAATQANKNRALMYGRDLTGAMRFQLIPSIVKGTQKKRNPRRSHSNVSLVFLKPIQHPPKKDDTARPIMKTCLPISRFVPSSMVAAAVKKGRRNRT
ncbi:MAG: hypothetical protein C4520_13100 [Candidatus Abyssobacteria bacterium SURF_5]|uniref:Uncharacterized protein n=1 Tax=Abyssobacteria bacterium (strain SURF_5) TaxID=2093360 RepID=A0A3A4NV03_ABYX5|nr:MAG: hypothetical protein C4520_13100 [Candidatus Abyssubacteria bacterium SURF_5]